jgi:Domain of unknown function (DUF4440)
VRQASDEEVQAFLHNDAKTMEGLWSDDFVVTNPLNKFVTKQQVLGMVQSGFLVLTSYERLLRASFTGERSLQAVIVAALPKADARRTQPADALYVLTPSPGVFQ